MKLSIVIPVYNSEKTIGVVIEQLKSVLDGEKYEVILINDGSKDNSYNVCKKLYEKNNNVVFINLSKNFGQHNALMAGYSVSKGEYVLSMDDDLQTSPSEVLRLLNEIEKNNYDVIFANYDNKKHSKLRNIGTLINNKMSEILIEKPKNLILTSFFIMKKYVVKEMLKYDGPYPYISGLKLRTTDKIGTIMVEHKERKIGKSNYTFWKLLKLWLNGFTSFSVKPLRIASITGLLFSLIGFLYGFFLIIRKLINPNQSVILGWNSLMVVLLVVSGIQIMFLGLIGEYIGRIYVYMSKKPQYVIKEIYKKEGDKNDTIQ